ncbi:hypothetical protein ACFLQN_01765 [Candidatus Aenigmatarchaeota archaeon]
MKFIDRTNITILILIVVMLALVLYPAFAYSIPITQTDGATHYIYAKTYSDTGDLNALNPAYNTLGSCETRISDYPPLTTIIFSSLISIFGNDVFFINGGLAAIFFLIASIFVFLFFKDVTNNKKIALLGLLFFVLNLRAYYTLTTGIFPSFISFCLTIPSLYFAYRFFTNKGNTYWNFIFMIVLNFLTTLTYTVQGAYLIFIEFAMWIGIIIDEKVDIKLPQINYKIKRIDFSDFNKIIYFLLPVVILFIVVFSMFTITESSSVRSDWLSNWASDLMGSCTGYPCAWNFFLITDGPVFILMAFLGSIYLFFKKQWKILSLVLASLIILLSGSFFINGTENVMLYLYRFYTTFFVFLSIPTSILIYKILSNKQVRNVGVIILVLILMIQVGKLGFFYSQMTPAITMDEYYASQELLGYSDSRILYVNNDIESGNFRAFKWIVVYARSENYDVENILPNEITGYDYVFVKNKNILTEIEQKTLESLDITFTGEEVAIYSRT